jgi:hypothetical protein
MGWIHMTKELVQQHDNLANEATAQAAVIPRKKKYTPAGVEIILIPLTDEMHPNNQRATC